MRFIAMQLRLALVAKFPETPQDDILKVVGNLLYYRYMNPAIVAPDAFDVVEIGVENQLGAEQRRNLGAIAKILQTAAAGKGVIHKFYIEAGLTLQAISFIHVYTCSKCCSQWCVLLSQVSFLALTHLCLQFEGENSALSNMNAYLSKAFEQFK